MIKYEHHRKLYTVTLGRLYISLYTNPFHIWSCVLPKGIPDIKAQLHSYWETHKSEKVQGGK